MASTFEDLNAWQEAHKFVLQIYTITKTFPKDEKFRLIDQLCRAASSVAANLVEGRVRHSKKEYLQFAYQAKGSIEEAKYHLLLSRDLNYISTNQYNELLSQATVAEKLINGLITYLKKSISNTVNPKNREQRTNN